jgi:hypothetical protein
VVVVVEKISHFRALTPSAKEHEAPATENDFLLREEFISLLLTGHENEGGPIHDSQPACSWNVGVRENANLVDEQR